ncbi:tetratricopeptide repeat protein [Spirosoma taeanense]|uniref:Tetratricopeptide repeat protein n=1 Tax=Spirosoma taeanense TaxID=2735870 RepID=A0A6M5Y739_9BACT|nr:histidine kinase dimerization/phosphoacceptor domain -containing protein [Spirosoma taeanense]QJW88893.1 tetratricopeptide repeat protein [Spirosoma taeanense]
MIVSVAAGQSATRADTLTINRWCRTAFDLLSANTDSANALSRQIVSQSQQIHYPYGLARGYALIGAVMRNQGTFDSAVYYAQKALPLFESQNRRDGIAHVYNLLAQTYKRMGDAQNVRLLTQKALQYADMARHFAFQSRNYSELSRAYNTLGISYRDLHKFDSARVNYLQAIAIETKYHPNPSYLPVSYANYGQILMDADRNFTLAIRFFKMAVPLYEQQHNLTGLEHAYRNLSWAYRQQGNQPAAMAAADKALALSRLVNDPHRLFNSLEAAYMAYRAAGNYAKAIGFLEEWKDREDSLMNVEKTRTIAMLEATYQFQRKEARIRQLAEENRRERRQMTYLTAGLCLLIFLFGGLFWQYQSIRSSRIRIRHQSDQMALMMKELHHRVKNNLAIVSSLLRLQSYQLTDERVAQAIRTGQQRVEAMALIHHRLYQTDNVTTVNMRDYLSDLANSLMQAYGYYPDEVDLHLDITKEWLEVDIAVPIGLIVNELVTNSFKHAYESVSRPMLRIRLHEQQGLFLEVQDNGPGIAPDDWEEHGQESFGKQLVASLCKQLSGVVEVRYQNGALFRMRFAEVN